MLTLCYQATAEGANNSMLGEHEGKCSLVLKSIRSQDQFDTMKDTFVNLMLILIL